MKKQDFISELLSYGTAFAMGFLVFVGAAIAFAVFLIVLCAVSFFDRVLS